MTSKRFKNLLEITKDKKSKSIKDLLPEIKKNCTTKFDESVDLSFQINNKQKKNEINIRTVVNLPGGTGKKIKVAVVCEEAKISEAKSAGADIVGGDDFIEKIKNLINAFKKIQLPPAMGNSICLNNSSPCAATIVVNCAPSTSTQMFNYAAGLNGVVIMVV